MKVYILISLCSLGIGFTAGMLMRPTAETEESAEVSFKSDRPAAPTATVQPPEVAEVLSIIDTYIEAEYGERDEVLQEVSSDDVPTYIEELLKTSGPDGMVYTQKTMIKDLLKKKMDTDRVGALQWILNVEHPANRDFLFKSAFDAGDRKDKEELKEWVNANYETILNMLHRVPQDRSSYKLYQTLIGEIEDVGQAIAMSKEYSLDPDGEINYPGDLQRRAVEAGWEYTFEYYKDSWKEGNTSWGTSWSGVSTSDFDFPSFVTAWTEHKATLPEDAGFYDPPVYVFREWAKQFPADAKAFAIQHPSDEFDYDDFLREYAEIASPKELFHEVAEGLAQKYDKASSLTARLEDYLKDRRHKYTEFLEWTQQTGSLEMYDRIVQRTSYQESELHQQLLSDIDPQTRIDYLIELYTKDWARLGSSQRENYQSTLTALGHSQEEIDRLLNPEPDQ